MPTFHSLFLTHFLQLKHISQQFENNKHIKYNAKWSDLNINIFFLNSGFHLLIYSSFCGSYFELYSHNLDCTHLPITNILTYLHTTILSHIWDCIHTCILIYILDCFNTPVLNARWQMFSDALLTVKVEFFSGYAGEITGIMWVLSLACTCKYGRKKSENWALCICESMWILWGDNYQQFWVS